MGLRETDGIFGGEGAQSGEAALRGKSSKWRRSSSEKRLGKRCFKGIWIPRLYNNNNNNNNNIKLGYKLVGVRQVAWTKFVHAVQKFKFVGPRMFCLEGR